MSPSERSLSRPTANRMKGADELRRQKAEGMSFARTWRAQHHPVPAVGHIPFAGHRTQAEVAANERRQDIAA